jgi:hypothetical protein
MSTTVTPQLEPEVLKARIDRFRQVQSEIVTQVRRVIVGQEEVLEQLFQQLPLLLFVLAQKRRRSGTSKAENRSRPW